MLKLKKRPFNQNKAHGIIGNEKLFFFSWLKETLSKNKTLYS